jgi:hypothetical protein
MALSADDTKIPCPKCGAPVYLTDSECMACGVALTEGRIAEHIPHGSPQTSASARPDTMPPSYPRADAGVSPQPGTTAPAVPYRVPPGTAPWNPARADLAPGFFPSLSRAWVFFKESLAMGKADSDVLIPSVLAVLANLFVAGVLVLILHLTDQLQPLLEEEAEPTAFLYSLLIGFTVIGYIISYFLTSMTVNMVDAYLRGQDANLKVAWADAMQNFWAILWLAVIATAVNLLTSAIRGKNRRSVSSLAADAVDKAWQVASLLLLPIIIIEDISFADASKRAMRLHKKSLIQLVVAEVGLTILQKVGGFLLLLIGILPAVLLYFMAPPLLYLGIGWAVLMLVLMTTLLMYVRTAFYTCLYLWAAAAETAGDTVPAPAPLYRALQSA